MLFVLAVSPNEGPQEARNALGANNKTAFLWIHAFVRIFGKRGFESLPEYEKLWKLAYSLAWDQEEMNNVENIVKVWIKFGKE